MIKEKISDAWLEAKELERRTKAYDGIVRVFGSRKGGPSASNITSCIRLTWYYAHNIILREPVEEGNTNNSLASMERVSDAYMHQDKFVQQLGNLEGCEVLNDDNYWVKCGEVPARVDVRVKINGTLFNIEFKSLGNYSFEKLEQFGLRGIPHYWAQCQVIAGGEIDTPVIFYAKNVENGKTYEQRVEIDEEYIDEVIMKGEDYYNRQYSDLPPEQPYEMDSPQCRGCPAREECWLGDVVHGEIVKREVDIEDRKKVRSLIDIMVSHSFGYEQYQKAYDNLKIYMEILHARYKFDRIQLRGIRSTLYSRRQTTIDWDKIYNLIGEGEYNKCFIDRYSKGQRIKIDWERFYQ